MLSLGEDDRLILVMVYPTVRNNIGGDIPIDIPPTKILGGCVPVGVDASVASNDYRPL